MVILGIADGPDASAALVIDGRLVAVESQERLERTPKALTFPWAAIQEVLADAGLSADHVDLVAVAGRFTPPFFLRRHPGLRSLGDDAFSPALDAGIFLQSLLRQTGLWALEADRAADWIGDQLRAKGFSMQRVVLVDIHRALAAAAYRCQPDDDVIAFTFHPMGDGESVGVYRADAGHIERVWTQRGFSALHVHLQRCAGALGYDPTTQMHHLWATAARGEPDERLLGLLDRHLHADGPRLSRRPFPSRAGLAERVYATLAEADPADAAASVLENLSRAVTGVIRHHLRQEKVRDVVLAGAVFDNPRLVAAVARLPEVETLWAEPFGGYAALAAGSAAFLGGIAPHALPVPGVGREYSVASCERALDTAGVRATKASDVGEALAGLLADGHAVARFQGPSGLGRWGLGSRTVLVRADDPGALATARAALGRPLAEEPGCALVPTTGDGQVLDADKLDQALRFGNVAVQVDDVFAARYPAVVTADGRAHLQRVDATSDPVLHRALTALHRRTGCAAVACLPLAQGADPIVAVPGDALRVWRRAGLAALLLGPYLVQRSEVAP